MSSENLLSNFELSTLGAIGTTGISLPTQEPSHNSNFSILCLPSSHNSESPAHIPYKDILWCNDVGSGAVQVTYSYEPKKGTQKIESKRIDLGSYAEETGGWAERIMKLSYEHSKPLPRILILLNNHGGQGNARKIYQSQILPVLRAAHVDLTYRETEYSKHATDIGREMVIESYDIVACCSGDGVPHEIINGFYERLDRAEAFARVAITQLPCGSGNALSLSSHGTSHGGIAALRMLKLKRTKMDVMAVTQGTETKLSFLSQAYGAIADSDIGTEHLRWMGPVRFDVGIVHKILTKARFSCDLYVKYSAKDKWAIQEHFKLHKAGTPETLHVSVRSTSLETQNDIFQLSGPSLEEDVPSDWEQIPYEETKNLSIFYVGKMPYVLSDVQFFPAALPSDGCMDMILTLTEAPFFKMARVLLAVERGGHVHSSDVHHAKITAYRLIPRISSRNHYISVDGESFPFEAFQVEVLPKVLTVLLGDGLFVETSFK